MCQEEMLMLTKTLVMLSVLFVGAAVLAILFLIDCKKAKRERGEENE